MDISRSQMDLKKDTIIKSAQAMQLPQKTSDKTWKLELFILAIPGLEPIWSFSS